MQIWKCFLLLASAILLSVQRLEYVFHIGEKPETPTLLVIAVLSAPNNTAARSSIRQTWKSFTNKPNIKFFFIIGENLCPIHPVDRKSELSCEALEFVHVSGKGNNHLWTPSLHEYDEKSTTYGITSFTFHTNFPVIIRGIQLWKGAIKSNSTSVVNLKNARTGSLITSVSFPALTVQNLSSKDWIEMDSDPFLLPKSFDVELQFSVEGPLNASVSNKDPVRCYGLSSWLNFSGSIEFTTQYNADAGWAVFDGTSCSPVSLHLELHGVETFLNERQSRSSEWQEQSNSLSDRLRSEAFYEKDILFVSVLDIYRNIPDKLLRSYEWIHKNVNFSFLLKTDDDTFVNIPKVEQYLNFLVANEERSSLSSMWWWGNLRHGLPVERHGKWQELSFSAPIYPPFPCGGGYILNYKIIEFLVTNSRWLHRFQGEDTSLGIWLTGVQPKTPKNAPCSWMCGSDCNQHSCSRGQLSFNSMFSVWQQFQLTDQLC